MGLFIRPYHALLLYFFVTYAGAQTANLPIYELTRNSQSSGYVIGSLHAGYLGPQTLPPPIFTVLANTKRVYFEADTKSERVKADGLELLKRTNLSKNERFEFWGQLEKELASFVFLKGLSDAQASAIQDTHPFVLTHVLSGMCESPAISNGVSLDNLIEKNLNPNAERFFIENAEQGLAWLSKVSTTEWADYIKRLFEYSVTANCADTYRTQLHKFNQALLRADPDEMVHLNSEYFRIHVGSTWFQDKILSRNAALAKFIDAHQSSEIKPIFVVGALHLGGSDSVLSELKRMGYRINSMSK
jgi:uncharacterized protein YbaP (TraB family)